MLRDGGEGSEGGDGDGDGDGDGGGGDTLGDGGANAKSISAAPTAWGRPTCRTCTSAGSYWNACVPTPQDGSLLLLM